MATQFTDSTSSGYMTDVHWMSLANRRAMGGHYSSPVATTAYINVGFPTISYVGIDDADPTTLTYATDSAGGVSVYFSGLVVGSTGYFIIIS